MNIFDTDRSGSINFMEFEGLYRYIQDWHGIFKRFDQDESGLIDRRELHAALQGFGFTLPVDMVAKLEKRFAPPPKANEAAGNGISFDRFLMACVTVKHYTEAFRRFDANNTGFASMDYNTFVSGPVVEEMADNRWMWLWMRRRRTIAVDCLCYLYPAAGDAACIRDTTVQDTCQVKCEARRAWPA